MNNLEKIKVMQQCGSIFHGDLMSEFIADIVNLNYSDLRAFIDAGKTIRKDHMKRLHYSGAHVSTKEEYEHMVACLQDFVDCFGKPALSLIYIFEDLDPEGQSILKKKVETKLNEKYPGWINLFKINSNTIFVNFQAAR